MKSHIVTLTTVSGKVHYIVQGAKSKQTALNKAQLIQFRNYGLAQLQIKQEVKCKITTL